MTTLTEADAETPSSLPGCLTAYNAYSFEIDLPEGGPEPALPV